MLTEKVLYRAQVKATAGRDTRAVSSDGVLDLTVTRPREFGNANGPGTTSEQPVCVRTPTPCVETSPCGWSLPEPIMLRFPARVK